MVRTRQITDLAFAGFCVLLLGIFKGGLLYHMEQFSLFPCSREFLAESMEQPGGILQYAGAFLTQFCHFPWLGAALLAAVLCLLAFLTRKSLCGGSAWTLSYIPSLLILLFICRLDYSVYLITAYGLLFSQALGLVAAISLLLAFRKWIDGRRWELPFIALVPVVFYPLVGVYALAAALLMAMTSGDRKVSGAGTMVISSAVVILFCSYMPGVYERIHRRYLLCAGLPYFDFESNLMALAPVGAAIVSLLVLPYASRLPKRLSAALLAVAGALVPGLANWDGNFRAVLEMERACLEQDWDRILTIAEKNGNPTRAQVLYRNIALYQKGRLTEDMFAYPDGAEPFHTGARFPLSYVCAVPVLHHCGMLNSSDRIAIEISSTYTKNIYFFKYQAKNALARGEYDLARRYIDMVSRNLFQGRWARHYRALAGNPEAIASDPEFAPILALTHVNSAPFDIVEPLELMIFRRFSDQDYVNEQIYEWQMACYMMWKDPGNVMYCFFQRASLLPGSQITRGIAEAAVLFASTSGDPSMLQQVTELMPEHQSTFRRFRSFSDAMNMVRNPKDPAVMERFDSRFGRSYWFYSVFNEMEAL